MRQAWWTLQAASPILIIPQQYQFFSLYTDYMINAMCNILTSTTKRMHYLAQYRETLQGGFLRGIRWPRLGTLGSAGQSSKEHNSMSLPSCIGTDIRLSLGIHCFPKQSRLRVSWWRWKAMVWIYQSFNFLTLTYNHGIWAVNKRRGIRHTNA